MAIEITEKILKSIKESPVESSNLKSVGYSKEHKLLTVTFKRNLKRYAYQDVEEGIYQQLISADSVGEFFHNNINGSYEYERI